MKILMILGHPDPDSLNHAIAHAIKNDLSALGHEVIFHDLYQEGFNPLLIAKEIPENGKITSQIKTHCHELASADGIVIVHPNWWGQPPAILKGWIDRVIRPGIAYRFEEGDDGEGVPIGLLKASAAVIINTSNTPPEREKKAFGDPLEAIWRQCIFDLCGVKRFYRRMFTVVVTSSLKMREGWIQEAQQLCRSAFKTG